MPGSGRETLPNVRKDLMDIQEWSVGPPRCPGVVGRLSRMSGNSREACLMSGVDERPSRMSGSGQENLPYGWE